MRRGSCVSSCADRAIDGILVERSRRDSARAMLAPRPMATRAWFLCSSFVAIGALVGEGCGSGTVLASATGATSSGSGGSTTNSTSTAGVTTSSTSSGSTSSSSSGTGGALPKGDCRAMNDCKPVGFMECVPPGGSAGCGTCQNPPMTCSGDTDCATQGATSICVPAACACMGQSICVPGCMSDAACGPGETCAPSHHCVPTTCATDAECPANFACTGGTCGRKSCTDDKACAGYCVGGSCYDMLGTCTMIPA
jgi:hypothetical protein